MDDSGGSDLTRTLSFLNPAIELLSPPCELSRQSCAAPLRVPLPCLLESSPLQPGWGPYYFAGSAGSCRRSDRLSLSSSSVSAMVHQCVPTSAGIDGADSEVRHLQSANTSSTPARSSFIPAVRIPELPPHPYLWREPRRNSDTTGTTRRTCPLRPG